MHRVTSAPSALLFLALAACQPSKPVAAPAPAAAAHLHPALAGCLAAAPGAKPACYEAGLLSLLHDEGVAAAMAALERAGEVDVAVKRDGHVYAHVIGLAAYEIPANVGEVYARCSPVFQSGCYHGVIQSYFVEQAGKSGGRVAPEAIHALCAAWRGEAGDPWLLFQCAHGMGHGLTMINGHHLPRALQACDLVKDGWEREACYGGAFMESIVQATAPHHTVGRPQWEGGGMEGHHPGGPHAGHARPQDGEPPYPALDPADPLYPCSALEERYLPACYQMQTSAILFLNEGDFAATGVVCGRAPEAYRAACFQSLGRDLSAYTVQDHDEAVRRCGLVQAVYRPQCHVGYVKNLVDLSAEPADGLDYCRVVPAADGRRACYTAVGEQVWVLGRTDERREALCRPAEAAYQEACRHGAGIANRE